MAPGPVVDDVASLVVSAQAGDRAAFAALYARYVRLVHGILLSRVPRAEAEDLVQDVFLAAMERLAALRDPSAFGGWLAAIARNRATHHLRRTPRTTELVDTWRGGRRQTAALAVMATIRRLPDAYRETLTLRLVEGHDGSGNRGVCGTDRRLGARQPASRHEAAARAAGTETVVSGDYLFGS